MPRTDTSEKGLESLICFAMTGSSCAPSSESGLVEESPSPYGATGWICGSPEDYDREYCLDLEKLSAFLRETQPEAAEALDLLREEEV